MLLRKKIPYILVTAAIFVACSDDSSSSSASNEDETPSSSSGLVGDTLIDSRDGRAYKVVTIGSQIWMAKNLNYETDGSFCYKNADSKCTQYGRLYKWDAAKKACPSGWHLPSKKDFETMLSTLGVLETGAPQPNDAPLKPQSKESGWNYTGTNTSGFTALPAGFRDDEGHYAQEYERAEFWTSTEGDDDLDYEYVYSMYISDYPDVGFGRSLTNEAFSVRCVYDEAAPEPSSSSEAPKVLSPCKTDSTDNCEYGTLKDDRDSQTYKTVKLGNQEWMAENLNYNTEGSFCYMDIDSNCTKYGQLYKWFAAMDSAGTFSTSGKDCGYGSMCEPTGTIRGVCPEGWHLPDSIEWHTLITAAGSNDAAGKALLSTTGWNSDRNGTDSFGFSAYPAGVRGINGDYKQEGKIAEFWTSTEYNTSFAIGIRINASLATIDHQDGKYEGRSVRCVKD